MLHSQKQSAHWALDVTAQLVPCWLSSWLKCTFWPVLILVTQVYHLSIIWVSCFRTASPGNIQSREQKITRVSYILKPESSLNLISPPYWILTQRWVVYKMGISCFISLDCSRLPQTAIQEPTSACRWVARASFHQNIVTLTELKKTGLKHPHFIYY